MLKIALEIDAAKRAESVRLQRIDAPLEKVDAGVRRLGGKFARNLAVCHSPDRMSNDLQERTAQLEVKLLPA